MLAVSQLISQTVVHFPRFAEGEISVQAVEKGGSDRKFYRIEVPGHTSLILAKYGSQREENRHYVSIARFLQQVGVRVPEIYFHDGEEGLIWMEDLGDKDLWSYRHEPWTVRQELYRSALDQLLTLHTRAHLVHDGKKPKLEKEFNAELYQWEQTYFFENCLGRYFKIPEARIARISAQCRLKEIAAQLAALPRCLVHRDFQSQNIVIKDGRACFIDFQGMRRGLPQYDLASLLYDPYVTLSPLEREALLTHYLAAMRRLENDSPAEFFEVLDLCAMQRLMQALGAYGFLGLEKERVHFLSHIPPALASLREVTGRVPGMEDLRNLLESVPGTFPV